MNLKLQLVALAAGAAALVTAACYDAGTPTAAPTGTGTSTSTATGTTEPTRTSTAEPTGAAGDAERGRTYFLGGPCIACHTVDGTAAVGTTGPNLTHVASNGKFAGDTFDFTAENLAAWLKDPPGMKPGTSMPNLALADADIADLVAFLQTLQ